MPRIAAFAMIILAALVAAGCGSYGEVYTGETTPGEGAAGEAQVSKDPFDEKARTAAGCTEIESFESEGNDHTDDIDEAVEYKHNPPHSGNHYQVPAPWGIYDESRRDVEIVHNLEHGHVVVSHKGLEAGQQDELIEQVQRDPFHILVQPRKDNPKDGVYYTAWTAQVYCEEPSAPALQAIIDEYRDQGPELFTSDPSIDESGDQ